MHLIIIEESLLCKGLIFIPKGCTTSSLDLPIWHVRCQGPIILSIFIWGLYIIVEPELLPASPVSCCKLLGLNTPLMLKHFSGCVVP